MSVFPQKLARVAAVGTMIAVMGDRGHSGRRIAVVIGGNWGLIAAVINNEGRVGVVMTVIIAV